jgi:hypothetical protein
VCRNTPTPRRGIGIATSLSNSISIYIDSLNHCLTIALCKHQGYESRTRTHIKQTAIVRNIGPSSKQYAIGAYLHSTLIIRYYKLLKPKHIKNL